MHALCVRVNDRCQQLPRLLLPETVAVSKTRLKFVGHAANESSQALRHGGKPAQDDRGLPFDSAIDHDHMWRPARVGLPPGETLSFRHTYLLLTRQAKSEGNTALSSHYPEIEEYYVSEDNASCMHETSRDILLRLINL